MSETGWNFNKLTEEIERLKTQKAKDLNSKINFNNKINTLGCIARYIRYEDMEILFQPKTIQIFLNAGKLYKNLLCTLFPPKNINLKE